MCLESTVLSRPVGSCLRSLGGCLLASNGGQKGLIRIWKFATQGPLSIRHRSFGLLAGAYQTAKEFGLIDSLRKHIEGRRYGTERWINFFITILNRLDRATSKNKMRSWIKKTILPDLLDIEVNHLTSKKYGYVTDDVISEAQLKEKRKTHPTDADDFSSNIGSYSYFRKQSVQKIS
jgi:hypothetical protein